MGLADFVSGRLGARFYSTDIYLIERKLAGIETLSRYNKSTSKMLDSLKFNPQELPTSALLDWFNILHRVPGVANQKRDIKNIITLLRNRLRVDSGMLRLVSKRRDNLSWLMVGRDTNTSRFMLSLMEFNIWKDDVPKILRGSIAQQVRGRWKTTTANAWGTIALRKFTGAYESNPVTGITESALAGMKYEYKWTENTSNDLSSKDSATFDWSQSLSGKGGSAKPEPVMKLSIQHNGKGSPWVSLRSRAAIPFKKPFSSGFTVTKMMTPVRQKIKGRYSIGDLIRVRITTEAGAAGNWVVVDDPVPPGTIVLGRGLAGSSLSGRSGEKRDGNVFLAFQENTKDSLRKYYEYVPRGTWSFEYTMQLNTAGTFTLPETRVEAMYNPDLYGITPNGIFTVDK